VNGSTGSYLGGLVGFIGAAGNGAPAGPPGYVIDSYWNSTTSGISNLTQGVGNIASYGGVSGLTTSQFRSGLSSGFDPTVWAESTTINGGLPYLLALPPA
jgi:hypothetical protein